ncbi:hypothetical protein BGW80DRAFT_1282324 [Lactifluus volemus]|nr:hypothetical protein BGW80DRAFT_1282324 [Lactifluus volemus]
MDFTPLLHCPIYFFFEKFLLTRWVSGECPLYCVKVLTELLPRSYHTPKQ